MQETLGEEGARLRSIRQRNRFQQDRSELARRFEDIDFGRDSEPRCSTNLEANVRGINPSGERGRKREKSQVRVADELIRYLVGY